MEVSVACKFLGVQRIMKKNNGVETGEYFEILHAYDGGQSLIKPFLTPQQASKFAGLNIGDDITLKMEIWDGKKGMGTRLIDFQKAS